MVVDYMKWQELKAWAQDRVRLGSEEDSVFFVLLLSKMDQIDSASNHPRSFSMQRGTLQETYPDQPFDGEDY